MADAPKVVAKAFVEKYYHFLLKLPKFFKRFYKDSSTVSWQGQDGIMSEVRFMKGISDHFLSFSNAKKFDILSFDTQDFLDLGLIVLVIGCMTFKNDKTRKFSEVFILVRQEEDYCVLNDVFRFLDDEKAKTCNLLLSANEPILGLVPDIVNQYYHFLLVTPEFLHAIYKDSSRVSWQGLGHDGVMSITTVKGISDHFISLSGVKMYDNQFDAQVSFNNGLLIVAIGCITLKNDEAAKKFRQSLFLAPGENNRYFVLNDVFSFLDDEDALKIHSGGTSDRLPSTSHEPATDQEANSNNPIIPVTETSCFEDSIPLSISAAENLVNAFQGTYIYVGNLGREIEEKALTESFKRFGNIIAVGIRRNKHKGCYGIIEFDSRTSAQRAIEASPIKVGDREIHIKAWKEKN